MLIKLRDTSLFVTYLQVFLKERLGLTVNRLGHITSSETLKITGIYDVPTFQSLVIYMTTYYPNERFPNIYYVTSVDDPEGYHVYKFEYDFNSLDKTITSYKDSYSDYSKETFSEFLKSNPNEGYLSSLENLYAYLSLSEVETVKNTKSGFSLFIENWNSEDQEELRVEAILSKSNDDSIKYPDRLNIDDRIMSYILGEVVSELSEEDEIYRIQKMLYKDQADQRIPVEIYGSYTNKGLYGDPDLSLQDYIVDLQTRYLAAGQLPQGFDDFKVTGYIDPWTELLLKNEVMISD